MKTHFPIFAWLLLPTLAFSQNQIAGIVNDYTAILSIDYCESKLTVADGSAFSIGDKVLLVQMQGAVIDESNQAVFGNITDIGSAGFFEKNEITAVNGNEIVLEHTLLNSYDTGAGGTSQLVSLPVFTDVTVADTLKAVPYNGVTGGIVAIEVENTLTLQAPIDASRAGFVGGAVNVVNSDCTFLTFAADYFYPASNWRGAPKGAGVARFIPGKEHGRGAQANGGGGGNDHNSGGGGGSHLALGGQGGKQSPPTSFGCSGNFPGLGGKPVPDFPDRIFMGGGGGAGHINNTGAAGSGGRGGGIIIIIAGSIEGNGQYLLSNGGTPLTTNGDGGAGGGAGGAILLDVAALSGDLHIGASGGNGGNVVNPSDRCFGPGGGGGGGRLVTNLTGFASVDLSGGTAGVNSTASVQCNSLTNEALPGGAGEVAGFAGIPASQEVPIATLLVAQPQPITGCGSGTLSFSVEAEGTQLSYQWQVNQGGGWVDLTDNLIYAGTQTPELMLLAPSPGMSGYQYRCLVTGPCTSGLTSMAAWLTVLPVPVAQFAFFPQGAGLFQFINNSSGATEYLWDFGNGQTSQEPNPLFDFGEPGVYTVTLTATGDCGSHVFTQEITVAEEFQAAFTSDFQNGCAPMTVQFEDLSSDNVDTWEWVFPGGIPPVSDEPAPVVTYLTPGVYDVSLTASNDQSSQTVVKPGFVVVEAAPMADFFFVVQGLTVNFTNLSSGGGFFLWDFGDGNTSNLQNPSHTYAANGIYTVGLTAANAACGSAIAYQVYIFVTGTDEAGRLPSVRVYPNPVGDILFIKLAAPPTAAVRGRLWDMQGRLVRDFTFQVADFKLETGRLLPGIYQLELRAGEDVLGFEVLKR